MVYNLPESKYISRSKSIQDLYRPSYNYKEMGEEKKMKKRKAKSTRTTKRKERTQSLLLFGLFFSTFAFHG